LDIWNRSVKITHALFDVADALEAKSLYRFAEQLRGAALSIPNNIQFLNFARRSVFEVANMPFVFVDRKLIASDQQLAFTSELEELSRMITGVRRSLE